MISISGTASTQMQFPDPLNFLATSNAHYCKKREQILWRTVKNNLPALTGKGINGIQLISEEEAEDWLRK